MERASARRNPLDSGSPFRHKRPNSRSRKIHGFDLKPGRRIAGKYEVVSRLGSGYEGEVYQIVETTTGIECAAKLFFPERNRKNKTCATARW